MLPNGVFRKKLRKMYEDGYLQYRFHKDLHTLNKMIKKRKTLQDGTLFLELNDGTKFYSEEKGDFKCFYAMLEEQFVNNVYEKYYKLKKGDVVVDIGANIGIFTVKAGNEGVVIAIEPEKNNLRVLERNIGINGLKNVVVIPKGVWSKKDKMRFYLTSTLSSSLVNNRRTDSKHTNKFIEIEVDTLDNMLKELRINRVDFIKMDIEGAEIEALKGLKESLKNTNVKLAIAAYHEVNGDATMKAIIPELEKLNFKVFAGGIIYAKK